MTRTIDLIILTDGWAGSTGRGGERGGQGGAGGRAKERLPPKLVFRLRVSSVCPWRVHRLGDDVELAVKRVILGFMSGDEFLMVRCCYGVLWAKSRQRINIAIDRNVTLSVKSFWEM